MKTIIQTPNAPDPIGPYSQAVMAGNLLYVSGSVAIEPATGKLVTTGIRDETRQAMENIRAILAEAGMGFENIIKTSIFITDMNDFSAVNEIYGSYFANNYPARETVEVAGLPKGASVEISVIASK